MYKVDLNCDLGESFGAYNLGLDKEIMKFITSANIACGWHAGDPNCMDKTVKYALENSVKIGAHPGFLDLMGFGRREMNVTKEEVKNYTKYQLGALKAFTDSVGCEIQHVKAHGALYNMAAKNEDIALGIAEAIYEVDKYIVLLGLANSEMINMGREVGLKVASEVFADRAYNPDGSLVSRKLPGAVIHDSDLAIKRVVRMVKERKVEAINGEDIDIQVDSICVHGDNPKALEFVKLIEETLRKENIEITNIKDAIGVGGVI